MGVHRVFAVGSAALCLLIAGLSLAGVADAEGEGCPNEVLRTELGSSLLPDCRAYEMVTPSYKEGYEGLVDVYSPDGEKAMFTSYGAFAGPPGTGENPEESGLYLAIRTPTGWQTTPLNVPLSEFVGQVPLAYEVESGATLWDQHTPQQPALTRGLYIRSADGRYTYIGRLNPTVEGEESNVIETQERDYDRTLAATKNYEHVVIFASSPNGYWKEFDGHVFDTTETELGSLYEYSGENNEKPMLVGVVGEKGSTDLIGKCGTALGSGREGSEYNALSASGEVIIFTVLRAEPPECFAAPSTTQLYVRVGGARMSATQAKTVPVSVNDCTEECGAESGKNFEGASETDEQIFFTSTQKLTNGAANGTESGNASSQSGCTNAREHGGCNLYEFTGALRGNPVLKTVAGGDEVLGVVGVADDGTRLYFVAAKLLPTSGKNIYGAEAQEGQPNLYVYDAATGATGFVATLSEEDQPDWQKSQEGRQAEIAGKSGEFLLFPSTAAWLIPGEKATAEQIYEYDAVTGELVRVSKGENGFNDNGLEVGSIIAPASLHVADFRTSANLSNIAKNGLTVVFKSKGQLSESATSAEKSCSSIYEFRTPGRLSEGSVHLISDGRDAQPYKGAACGAKFNGMDAQGENILFSTADPLLPTDVNGVQRDVYDARVDGGFPAAVEAGTCSAGTCEAPGTSSPSLTAPGSMTQAVEGDVTAPAPAVSSPKPAPKTLTRAQELKRALTACSGKPKRRRAECRVVAERRFGAKKVKQAEKGGK
jgi:hypothetical protein